MRRVGSEGRASEARSEAMRVRRIIDAIIDPIQHGIIINPAPVAPLLSLPSPHLGLSVVALLVLLSVDLLEHLIVLPVEVLLDLNGHAIDVRLLGVVDERVIEGEMAVRLEGIDGVVVGGLDVRLDSAEVHGFLDY